VAINFEHLHLLIEPTGKYNYSEIMGSIKRNFTRDCNDLMAGRSFLHDAKEEKDSGDGRGRINRKYKDIRGNPIFIAHLERLEKLHGDYFRNGRVGPKVPFKWHNSFRDHLIRDEDDYLNHLNYIMRQPLKHKLPGRKWYWITGDDWEG
jgi:REP element-mobilizing transposase RayT